MIYHCCDELRRNAVAAHATLNGIDHLEVVDDAAPAGSPPQQTLLVRLLKPVPAGLGPPQVRIEGGERVRGIRARWAAPASGPVPEASAAEQGFLSALPEPENVLVVRTSAAGDFSTYRLRLVRNPLDHEAPPGFDPVLAAVDFSFKVECPSEFDCRRAVVCRDEPPPAPVIDYLARDYPSFRRLLLDRVTQLVPDWRERSAADLGVTLAELLAYVADQLSYQQDAVATEAYLETARLRTSLRRHALLVDYHVHDGCNARAWLHVEAGGDGVPLPRAGTRFYTRVPGLPSRIVPDSREDREAQRLGATVFEPLADAVLRTAHNRIPFHTWGDERCCLPAGATEATLAGHLTDLAAGSVLLFEEVLGPATGRAADADPAHRHVVRLTTVTTRSPDDASQPLTDPLTGEEITRIAWHPEDALPFALCISSVADAAHGASRLSDVSVARGNMVPADHGFTLPAEERLGTVPEARPAYPGDRDADRCRAAPPEPLPPRFRPALAEGPLTMYGTVVVRRLEDGEPVTERVTFDPGAPAASLLQWRMQDTIPAIVSLLGMLGGEADAWEPRRDLLGSEAGDHHVVAEVEHDGIARLRFGDDVLGKRPDPGTGFTARYRVGNGRAGNVGADTIAHVVCDDTGVAGVRNPLPAAGGEDPEDDEVVRRRAPQAFRRQERAVTPEDYAEVTQRHPGIQRAAATLRWTGSWHTVFVTVDRVGGLLMNPDFEQELTRHVERYRMAGHDTEFDDPVYVSLEIDLFVCVAAGHLRSAVKAALFEELGNRILPDGRRGLFHPDNLTFGQVVHLSPLYAAARRVAGVASVEVTRFHAQGVGDTTHLERGWMRLGRLQIPRMDNDPNFPEHGVLRLSLSGGA